MAEEFARHNVGFVFLYTREAHPGENYPHHTSMEQKLSHARDMAKKWSMKRPMLVDDMEGTLHRAYGCLPNMTYILNAAGVIIYRAAWTDPRTIRIALDQLVFEREQRRRGVRITNYYVEWLPQRVNDRIEFMEGLIRDAGPKAVEEFIAMVANSGGEAAARQLRDWWAEKQKSLTKAHGDG
ncbi:MAG: hypothetical protein L0177_10930 [Chloroflexi bacterium]|nr:hypothetical protein [Chloroflexota bacterium]